MTEQFVPRSFTRSPQTVVGQLAEFGGGEWAVPSKSLPHETAPQREGSGLNGTLGPHEVSEASKTLQAAYQRESVVALTVAAPE
jgi:hypothetical protein